MIPGEIKSAHGDIILNKDAPVTVIKIINKGDRPVQVGSHFHFYEVNSLLHFDREKAYGNRLNIPSGTAVRFEPGMEKTVELIPYTGKRIVIGFNGKVNKALGEN
jgi:urease subunit beta